jgi:P-type Ca2+ transporter type 2C
VTTTDLESRARAAAWVEEPIEAVAAALGTDPVAGLAPDEAARRLARDGANEIQTSKPPSRLAIAVAQFRSLLIWILLGAAGIAAALGEWTDGIAIVTIVIINAAIGFVQEYRADRAAAALTRLVAPRARVVRGGRLLVLPAADIVRGDVLQLDAGDLVAGDARLLETAALRTEEAPLTGESQPVDKRAGSLPSATPLAERTNAVFLGTRVVGGSGRALVVATGMATELGQIARLLATAAAGVTPLQRRLDQLGRRLLWASGAIVAVVFLLGWLRATPPYELFLAAIGLAVAAIPEGLPAVVTVALALGVQRMARRRALVRRLPSVETLGGAQVICTDKTGTLTLGQMTARRVVTADSVYTISGEGYAAEGAFFVDGTAVSPGLDLLNLLRAAAACNDAWLDSTAGRLTVVGDPTEGALLIAAAKAGLDRAGIDASMPRVGSVPFDSDRKRMTVVRLREGRPWAFVKGAPEVILERCGQVWEGGCTRPLTEGDRAAMAGASTLLASEALRVLAFAERPMDDSVVLDTPADAARAERDLVLLGLIGLQDPPRPEARSAVASCRRAGIRIVMITGDHPTTARAIAREVGILGPADEVMVGPQLDAMPDRELAEHVAQVAVYARVTAEHKLRIVRAWKTLGAVVAMTGDGANDAPALREASIGVAMGLAGTEVTKEAADLIIADDNFASIVAAVEEGRGIYDNIAKTLAYLLAGNAAELAVMLVAAVIGWPLPLLPLHLLWINLVTDGLPALALATDPVDSTVLARPPRPAGVRLLDAPALRLIALGGGITATVTLAAFGWELYAGRGLVHARDAAFTVLVIGELLRAFGARSDSRSLWQLGVLSNLRLAVVVAVSYALQIAIHHVPLLAAVFGISPVSLGQCLAWTALGAVPLVVLELRKLWLPASAPAASGG